MKAGALRSRAPAFRPPAAGDRVPRRCQGTGTRACPPRPGDRRKAPAVPSRWLACGRAGLLSGTVMRSSPPTSIDSFKALARTWAATVTVVTARRASPPGEVVHAFDGFTATAFFTVSMVPPIIVVSATTAATAFTMLRDAEAFAVNLLAPVQADLAAAFAKPHVERAGLWDRIPWEQDEAGVPLLGGATGAFSARGRQ